MVQRSYDTTADTCRILGTSIGPGHEPPRANLTGFRPGTSPLFSIPDDNQGVAPGTVRDRKCSPEVTILGSTENNKTI